MDKVQRYWKAIAGFIAPGVVALVAAVTDASPAGTHITVAEWVGIGAAMVLTGAAVYVAPKNREPYQAAHYRNDNIEPGA